MNNEIILFFLCICIAVLICIVVYQQFVFRRGIQKQLKEISQKLEKIQDTDSDENIMMFTDEQALMELLVQINRLLENQRKMKVDYRRSQISAKMHSRLLRRKLSQNDRRKHGNTANSFPYT